MWHKALFSYLVILDYRSVAVFYLLFEEVSLDLYLRSRCVYIMYMAVQVLVKNLNMFKLDILILSVKKNSLFTCSSSSGQFQDKRNTFPVVPIHWSGLESGKAV